MKKLLPLFLAVMLAVALAVPSFASSATNDYASLGLPPLPKDVYPYMFVLVLDNGTFLESFDIMPSSTYHTFDAVSVEAGTNVKEYKLIDGDWVSFEPYISNGTHYYVSYMLWANFPIQLQDGSYWNSLTPCDGSTCPATDVDKNNICDDCGMPFSVPRDYSPFTVGKFMNHIGQIFTSAVSWVSDVGAAILAQPLLLTFTALPLCGLGIAVFRRLKETV